jgi:hypothetical protein
MQSEDSQADLWEIYRLELVFLNPEEYRWQLFQYWPGIEPDDGKPAAGRAEAVYRLQAQSLLGWVYASARLGHFANPEPEGEVRIDVAAIREEMLLRMGDQLTDEERQQRLSDFIDGYCKHTSEIVDAEGLPKGTVDWIADIKSPEPSVRYLDRTAALDITSALFVANSWDLYGRISFPDERNIKDPISGSAIKSFDYSISYPNGKRSNLLGYPIDLVCSLQTADAEETGSKDAQRQNPLGSLVECKDYFEHCNPIESEEQKLWYCMYGFLIDQINKYGANRDTLYVRCFPLRICGYDHFLQILVRNRNGAGKVGSLPPVFNKGIDTIVLKECLRELMVPMHITAFQRHAAKHFDGEFRTAQTGDNYLHRIFAQHAPNLVKMNGLWLGQAFYGYAPSNDLAGFRRWRLIEPGGEGWEKRPPSNVVGEGHCVYVDTEKLMVVRVPWERRFSKLSPLLSGTGKQRLQEQWDWLNHYAKRKRFTEGILQLTRGFDNDEN